MTKEQIEKQIKELYEEWENAQEPAASQIMRRIRELEKKLNDMGAK